MMRQLGLLCLACLGSLGTAMAADWDATVQWSRRVELGPPVSGVVMRVNAEVGQRVNKNDLLLALEETPFRAALQAAQAELTRRELELKEAQRDAQQAKELYDRTVLSTVELENAQWKLTRAEAARQRARAELEQARYRLRVSSLRAPFDAYVLSRQVEAGQSIVAELNAPALLVLVAAGEYLAKAVVPVERATGLKSGQSLTVRVDNERFGGKVKSVGLEPVQSASGKDGGYELHVVFESNKLLRAGQPAKLEFP